jgi:hypothetical protein
MNNYQRRIITNQTLPGQGIRVATAAQEYALGTVLKTDDGRVYRYAQAGASALAPGKMA